LAKDKEELETEKKKLTQNNTELELQKQTNITVEAQLQKENCKITEPMHFWTRALLRAFCTISTWQKAQKNGKKWVSFKVSFTPPCQLFRHFRLFPSLLIFIM
jgi:hypothetical protein